MSARCFKTLFIAAAFILSFAMTTPVYAAWSNDPTVNTPVSAATGYQEDQRSATDGSGGTIIVWNNYHNNDPALGTSYGDIYVQRIDTNGNAMWGAGGMAITTATKALNPRITSDESGGAIIAWEHYNGTNYDIYAQRIDSTGAVPVSWPAGGKIICNASRSQRYPILKTDGSGGAIIVWQDNRNGSADPTNYDIYAQRINSTGTVQWLSNGVAVCAASEDQKNPRIISDDAGGAIITWQDNRHGSPTTTNYDIYAQKINSGGVAQWTVAHSGQLTEWPYPRWCRLITSGCPT
jgi:hypothetical protein